MSFDDGEVREFVQQEFEGAQQEARAWQELGARRGWTKLPPMPKARHFGEAEAFARRHFARAEAERPTASPERERERAERNKRKVYAWREANREAFNAYMRGVNQRARDRERAARAEAIARGTAPAGTPRVRVLLTPEQRRARERERKLAAYHAETPAQRAHRRAAERAREQRRRAA